MHIIYKITSPSGKSYIGITRQKLSERWRQHYARAFTTNKRHPFLEAIRKYGKEAFLVEQIDEAASEQEALALEVHHIAEAKTNKVGYNLSAGGEYDWEKGVESLAERRKDPQFDAQYRANLSLGCRVSEAHAARWGALASKAQKWREDNPKMAWKASYRASRIASKVRGGASKRDPRFSTCGRLWMGGAKHIQVARAALGKSERTAVQWATRSAEERAQIFKSISDSHKKRNANKTAQEKTQADAQLSAARKNINHEKRIAALRAAADARWAEKMKGLPPEKVAKLSERREKARLRALAKYYESKGNQEVRT